jgi:hypothetical protein
MIFCLVLKLEISYNRVIIEISVKSRKDSISTLSLVIHRVRFFFKTAPKKKVH